MQRDSKAHSRARTRMHTEQRPAAPSSDCVAMMFEFHEKKGKLCTITYVLASNNHANLLDSSQMVIRMQVTVFLMLHRHNPEVNFEGKEKEKAIKI